MEEDWAGWKLLTEKLGHIQLVGDDLGNKPSFGDMALNRGRLIPFYRLTKSGLDRDLRSISIAKDSGYSTIISHRSGKRKIRLLPTFSTSD